MATTKAELEHRVMYLEKELEGMREAVRTLNTQLETVLSNMADLRTDAVDLRQFCDAVKGKLWPVAPPQQPKTVQPVLGASIRR